VQYVLFRKNNYHKNRNVFIDDNSLPSEIHINYSKLSLISVIGYFVFIILGMYFIKLAGLDYQNIKEVIIL
jgi:hypothetical protein